MRMLHLVTIIFISRCLLPGIEQEAKIGSNVVPFQSSPESQASRPSPCEPAWRGFVSRRQTFAHERNSPALSDHDRIHSWISCILGCGASNYSLRLRTFR